MNVASVHSVSLASLAADASAPVNNVQPPAKAVDVASFQNAMANAAPASADAAAVPASVVSEVSPAFKAILSPLMSLNGRASALGAEADSIGTTNQDLKPGEMVKLTFHCYEFMFQSEVTSNVANRTSDGVQQLFREQS